MGLGGAVARQIGLQLNFLLLLLNPHYQNSPMLRKLLLCTCIFIPYIIVSWVVGEVHPFSRFPMYDSFPNWSYIFYIKTQDDKVLSPFVFGTQSGYIAHMYYSACQQKGIMYGNGMESADEMKLVADEILANLLQSDHSLSGDTLYFYRKYFYLKDGASHNIETLMTSIYVE